MTQPIGKMHLRAGRKTVCGLTSPLIEKTDTLALVTCGRCTMIHHLSEMRT